MSKVDNFLTQIPPTYATSWPQTYPIVVHPFTNQTPFTIGLTMAPSSGETNH